MPSKSLRLLCLSLVLGAAAVVLAVWAASAFSYASGVRHWPSAVGTVVRVQPAANGAAAVRYADLAGNQHVMPLKPGDTDDLPVGSIVRISYDIAADGKVRSEFRFQPGARASALTVLALVAATGAAVTGWRSRAERGAGH
ncbi:MAG: hypothetical protein QOE76_937 [Frankiales bacterium]|nr:hypothetical protein [Frankiales bacterium]MDX6243214.1 hypothetical protein [Frankiales bacterium]